MMIRNLEVVIGLENHIQLKTATKMFSPGPVTYGAPPNSQVAPLDMGFPGVLPAVNKEAVKLAIQMSYLLHMDINHVLRFDRKKYYHSDLPKGYQITQQYHPLGTNGYLIINNDKNKTKKIAIQRLQIEEDTAKQMKVNGQLWIDYNRAGIPLVEIVTLPVFRTSEDVCAYLKKLIIMLRLAKISDADMSLGSFRCDVNISLRPFGSQQLGKKVEIKNINSINNITLAIKYEIKRQTTLIHKNQTIRQETRRFDDKTKTTVVMRVKTDDIDYCYFQEPNIAPIQLSTEWIQAKIAAINPTYEALLAEYTNKYQLEAKTAQKLLKRMDVNDFFQASTKLVANATRDQYRMMGTWCTENITAFLHKQNLKLNQTALTPRNFIKLLQLKWNEKMSSKQSKQILTLLLQEDTDPSVIFKRLKWVFLNDEQKITNMLKAIVEQNKNFINKHQNWPERLNKFLMGQLMKQTKGQASPQIAQKIITALLKKRKNDKI